MLQIRVVLFVIIVTKALKLVCGDQLVKRGLCSFCNDIWLLASITQVYYVAADDSYNTEDYSHGREGDQQCNTDAQTMVVPDIAPPQFSFVHTWRPTIIAGGQTLERAGLQLETFFTEDFTPTPQITPKIFGCRQGIYRQLVLHLKLTLCHMKSSKNSNHQ